MQYGGNNRLGMTGGCRAPTAPPPDYKSEASLTLHWISILAKVILFSYFSNEEHVLTKHLFFCPGLFLCASS